MTKLLMTHPAFCGTTSWVTCLSLRVSFCHTDRIWRENLCWKTWDGMSGLKNACNEGILTMSGLFLFQEFLGWRWAFRIFTVWMPIVGKTWPRMLCCWSHVNYKNACLNVTESSWLISLYQLISISCPCVLVLVWGTSFMMFPLKWNGTQLAFIEWPSAFSTSQKYCKHRMVKSHVQAASLALRYLETSTMFRCCAFCCGSFPPSPSSCKCQLHSFAPYWRATMVT